MNPKRTSDPHKGKLRASASLDIQWIYIMIGESRKPGMTPFVMVLQFWQDSLRQRLQNIADGADRKAHNLYLNHTQATPNAGLGVSDPAVVAIASRVLHDVCLITINNSDLVVDRNKLRRGKAKVRKDLKFQALSEAQALPLKGLYFDGRKDSTLIEERVDTKRYTRKAKEEHLSDKPC
ncbi:hypothetical protein AVEN_79792-1 [Araneus ventricosus]|uniref:Uncharacterized protein n=1 Tax=Araneus ventricosus TaxID=182803 RepID=A0A4Y2FYV0_ARAVE|nr:hypothetical protein AVEN_79792-1 [Araneus ventricosus]